MKICVFVAFCCVVTLGPEVLADGENEIRRGVFPYMAFIYYPDETVMDSTGARFMRSAVLIRPDWLITSAIGPSALSNESEDFPRKTLLARLGAITIDSKFTLNEDENEQEREIIQIVRPFNHSVTQWWRTDITLMKTLLPFNITPAVDTISLNNKAEYVDKNCVVLVYARKSSKQSEEKVLMQLSVELIPPSMENCGRHFIEDTMTCATDSEDTKNAYYDPNYCRDNSGGPLICEGDVIGLQTYIENNCYPPHLYQLISAWDNFITCGTAEKCTEEQCSNTCIAANKDVSRNEEVSVIATVKVDDNAVLVDENTSSTLESTNTTMELKLENTTKKLMSPTFSTRVNATSTTNTEIYSTEKTTTKTSTIETSILKSSTSEESASETLPSETSTSDTSASDTEEISTIEMSQYTTKSWPQNVQEAGRFDESDENVEQKANVEARQQDVKVHLVQSAALKTMSIFDTLMFGSIVLLCVL